MPDLEALANAGNEPYEVVRRAQMIVFSAAGLGRAEVARRLGSAARTVCKWCARFRKHPSVETLEDRARSGRPTRVPIRTRCRLMQLACDRPADHRVPFRDVWSHAALSDALCKAEGVRLSVSEVGRILRFEDLRPHRIRQWLHSCRSPTRSGDRTSG